MHEYMKNLSIHEDMQAMAEADTWAVIYTQCDRQIVRNIDQIYTFTYSSVFLCNGFTFHDRMAMTLLCLQCKLTLSALLHHQSQTSHHPCIPLWSWRSQHEYWKYEYVNMNIIPAAIVPFCVFIFHIWLKQLCMLRYLLGFSYHIFSDSSSGLFSWMLFPSSTSCCRLVSIEMLKYK